MFVSGVTLLALARSSMMKAIGAILKLLGLSVICMTTRACFSALLVFPDLLFFALVKKQMVLCGACEMSINNYTNLNIFCLHCK